MMMKNFLLLASIFCIKTVVAQVGPSADTATVIVHKDPRVDALAKKQASVNAAYKRANARSMRGYRLLIVNTNKRDEAIEAKTKIYTYFPELKAYLVYQTPYFKLKAGNFKTRVEAEKYRQNMNMIFPKGVFIVNDTIEVRPEREKEQVE